MNNGQGSRSCFRHTDPSQNLVSSVQSFKSDCLLSKILSKYINHFTKSVQSQNKNTQLNQYDSLPPKTLPAANKSNSTLNAFTVNDTVEESSFSTTTRNTFVPFSSSHSRDVNTNLESGGSNNWLSKASPASAVKLSKPQKPSLSKKSQKLNSKSPNVTLKKFFQPTQKPSVSDRSIENRTDSIITIPDDQLEFAAGPDIRDPIEISDNEEEPIRSMSCSELVDVVMSSSSGDEFLPPPNRSLNHSFKSQTAGRSNLSSYNRRENAIPSISNLQESTSDSNVRKNTVPTPSSVPKPTSAFSTRSGNPALPSPSIEPRSSKGFAHKEPSGSLLRLIKLSQNSNGLTQSWTQLLHHYKHKLKDAEENEKAKQMERNTSSRVPQIYGERQTDSKNRTNVSGDEWSTSSNISSRFSGGLNNYQPPETSALQVEENNEFTDFPSRNDRNSLAGYMSPFSDQGSSNPPPPCQNDNDIDWGPDFECDDLLESVSNIEASTSTANKSEYFQNSRNSTPMVRPTKQQPEVNDDSAEFNHTNFPHYQQMLTVFRQQFGLAKFRMKQREALNAAMLGHDCFVLMPTGGGKSVCYQLPALLQRGLTVVISPLRSLILDQVNKLKSLDIPAACLMGDNSQTETNRITSQLCRLNGPEFHLLFVTPEKVVASRSLVEILQGLYNRGLLARFVIDEAHCVSQWGHDFRPDYKRLSKLRTQFPGVPMMALTATATLRVRKDILHQLQMTNTKWFVCSFDRPNLSYSVREKTKTTLEEIISLIKTKYPRKSGIVYGFSRKECEQTAQSLKNAGIQADCYHAGLNDKQRTKVQTDWVLNKIKVVVATIAFGMGIDKPDVRFVIHFTMAKSIEGYYQEAGRAGRDGDTAECVLYYAIRDVLKLRRMIDMDTEGTQASKETHRDNLRRMVAYCENRSDCRRTIQLQYFGENYTRRCPDDPATACDNCLSQERYRIEDVTEVCRGVVMAVRQICGRSQWDNFTINHLVDVCKGSRCKKVIDNGHDRLEVFASLSGWDKVDICRLVNKLVMDDILAEFHVTKFDNTNSYIRLGPRAQQFVNGGEKIVFSIRESTRRNSMVKPAEADKPTTEVDEIHERCFSELMDVVTAIAEINEVNTNTIMNIQSLKGMSLKLPETKEEMLKIIGVTQANYEKYGKDLLKITSKYAEERNKLNFVEPKKRSLSPSSFRAHTGPSKKRKSSTAEVPPGSYVAPYMSKFKNRNKKRTYKPQNKGVKTKKGKSSSNYRAKTTSETGSGSFRATASSSHTTLQPNRTLPPSNRPGFMPAPRVSMVRK